MNCLPKHTHSLAGQAVHLAWGLHVWSCHGAHSHPEGFWARGTQNKFSLDASRPCARQLWSTVRAGGQLFLCKVFGSSEHVEDMKCGSLSLGLASLPSYRKHRNGHRRIAQAFRALGAGLTVIMLSLW